jgi:hypothetical protein
MMSPDGPIPGSMPTDALELTDSLESGWEPPEISVPMRMDPGERCFAQAPVTVARYFATDAEWTQKRYGFSLDPMVVGLKMVTAVGNSWRKSRAKRKATAQWRSVGRGTVFLTDRRLMIRHDEGWASFWFNAIMETHHDRDGITIEGEDMEPTRLAVPDVDYYFVLFYWFAFGKVFRPQNATARMIRGI